MNSINIIGRITADPELKVTTNNIPVCSFTLAVKRPKVKDTTDFLPVVAWRQAAEYISKYAQKGSIIAVSGVLTARKYETNNGDKRIAYEIVTDSVSVLSGNTSSQTSYTPAQNSNEANQPVYANEVSSANFEQIAVDGDLPF